ncbi:hypothetical protein BJ138DRAFT_490173 [Hygrophoropsis aurantiaca]|uniref:Uncharacterized protein n=1 Tax=Hygrophoropsis aurantiaca TaxID=72124 RepID=A0ACB8AMC3_9AGAM|nr:hypothetical protein BJ138DRAFT_490173 [Hygrophoropsis aurantiaca]
MALTVLPFTILNLTSLSMDTGYCKRKKSTSSEAIKVNPAARQTWCRGKIFKEGLAAGVQPSVCSNSVLRAHHWHDDITTFFLCNWERHAS